MAADALIQDFMKAFDLTTEENMCKYNPGNLQETDICVFEVSGILSINSNYYGLWLCHATDYQCISITIFISHYPLP